MVKKIIATAVLVVVGNSVQAAPDVYTGQVSFSGVVENAACAISAGDITGQTIDMGNIPVGELSGLAGKKSAAQFPFSITLEKCASSVFENAKVTFTGTAAPGFNTILAGGATGVGVEIFDSSNNALDLGNASAAYQLEDGTNVLAFKAGYAAMTDTPQPGQVSATANFNVSYE